MQGNLKHFASPSFWNSYSQLPSPIQVLADKNFEILKSNPQHPSLHLKKVGQYWSARVGRKYRAVAIETEDGLIWLWIGTHAAYDKLITISHQIMSKNKLHSLTFHTSKS